MKLYETITVLMKALAKKVTLYIKLTNWMLRMYMLLRWCSRAFNLSWPLLTDNDCVNSWVFHFRSFINVHKGSLSRDFRLQDFFMKQFSPGHIRNFVFIAGVNDTVNKLFTSVNNTGYKLSSVSLLLMINYCRCRWHCWLRLEPCFHRYQWLFYHQ